MVLAKKLILMAHSTSSVAVMLIVVPKALARRRLKVGTTV